MYDLLIKKALVYDGSGNEGQVLDVAVQGDKIVNINQDIPLSAKTIINADRKILAPGFIDIQNHSDSYWQIFDNPNLDSLITQGITTILIGNCGASLAPLLSKEALLSLQKWHSLEGTNLNWQSFGEFIEELSHHRYACNIGSLIGYSTLRRGIVGDQIRSLEKEEFNALKKILNESLEAGAFGLSSGLSYAHEIIISELELYELAKIIKKNNALFSIHLRSEGAEIIEALEEALDIAKTSEVNLKISHLKIRNDINWFKYGDLIQSLETAYHKGVNVHFDIYPYDTIWHALYSYLPKWAIEGGRKIMLKHFENPVQRNKILNYLNNSTVRFPVLLVASASNKLNFTGKSIGQIAKNLECSSEQAILHLITNGGSEVLVFEKNLNLRHIENLMLHPLSFIATDGGGFKANTLDKLIHPRCFGTAPKFLKEIVITGKLSWAKAIMKLTSAPAKKIGLKKRGEIKIGNFADLVILNEKNIQDKATYENPFQYSEGIEYVFVNGIPTIFENQITNQLPGYVLRKK